jgi:hypothetical protein
VCIKSKRRRYFLEGYDSVSSAPSSYGPDLPSELGSLSGRSGVDQRNSVGHVHSAARIAFDAHDCVHPLAERFGSLGLGWIVLVRGPAESRAFECVRAADVTGPARPYEISGRAVLLVSIDVSDFDIALPSAQCANALARRWAASGAVSLGTVSYFNRLLAPISRATPGVC